MFLLAHTQRCYVWSLFPAKHAPLCLRNSAVCSLLTSYGFLHPFSFSSLPPCFSVYSPSGEVTQKLIQGKIAPTRSLCCTCSLHLPHHPPGLLLFSPNNRRFETCAALDTRPPSPLPYLSWSRHASCGNSLVCSSGCLVSSAPWDSNLKGLLSN